MRFLKLLFKRETFVPMAAMTFASATSIALIFARVFWTGHLRYGFLAVNLFLAWLPLVFAMLACHCFRDPKKPGWRFISWSAVWLLFFPNSAYIFTDLIHLTTHYSTHLWLDFILILSCAFTGLVVGFVSLYLMQAVVVKMYGRLVSWFFVFSVTALSGFGIYLGRFLRFNSWDIIVHPNDLYHGVTSWAANSLASSTTFVFPILFATFLFIAYVLLYALTHLPQMNQLMAEPIEKQLQPSS
ncbi:MAG TPA: DUF1361 domain-containing protein [Verrucomicrobiae bacterium]|jgi:uncharacterized membrane protein|nr:DUF1361 domain-containing protein [Verrucomicrobiae bacterium]